MADSAQHGVDRFVFDIVRLSASMDTLSTRDHRERIGMAIQQSSQGFADLIVRRKSLSANDADAARH